MATMLEELAAAIAPNGSAVITVMANKASITLTAPVESAFATVNGSRFETCPIADIEQHARDLIGRLEALKRQVA